MERIIYFVVIISASFTLGFMCGSAYVKRKMRRREEEKLISQGRVKSEVVKHGPTGATGKIKDDEDTKTGELEIEKVTKGHPDDA